MKRSKTQMTTSPPPHKFRKVETVDIVVDGHELTFSKQILFDESPVFKAMFSNKNFKEGNTGRIEMKQKSEEEIVMMLYFLSPRMSSIETEPVIDARKVLPLADEYQITRLKNSCEEKLIAESDKTLEHAYLADKHNLQMLLENVVECCSQKDIWELIWKSEPLLRKMGYKQESFIIKPTGTSPCPKPNSLNGGFLFGSNLKASGSNTKRSYYTKSDLNISQMPVQPPILYDGEENLFSRDKTFYRYADTPATYFSGVNIMEAVEKIISRSTIHKIFSKRLYNLSSSAVKPFDD